MVAEVMTSLRSGRRASSCLSRPEQEVDVERPLVRLVEDDRVVRRQVPVALHLRQQDAVGHQLDEGVLADLVVEAHRVADGAAERGAELLGDALGHRARGQPPGLRVPDQTAHAAAELEADLGDLRRLAGARLTGDDHDLVVPDRGGDVVAPLRDRKVLGEVDAGRDRRLPPGQPLLRGLDVALEGRRPPGSGGRTAVESAGRGPAR
jgi:hypothetical protein